jgi:hypothetical protein
VDFIDELRLLASRIANTRGMISTEEATKNSMIMPMIKLLGYDPFNPMEVTPELIADVGTKKGEKVDYAILRDGKPISFLNARRLAAISASTMPVSFFDTFTLPRHVSACSPTDLCTSSSPILSSPTEWTRSRSSNSTSLSLESVM